MRKPKKIIIPPLSKAQKETARRLGMTVLEYQRSIGLLVLCGEVKIDRRCRSGFRLLK